MLAEPLCMGKSIRMKRIKAVKHYPESENRVDQMSHDTRFPTVWYVGPAKPRISLHIHAV